MVEDPWPNLKFENTFTILVFPTAFTDFGPRPKSVIKDPLHPRIPVSPLRHIPSSRLPISSLPSIPAYLVTFSAQISS